MQLIPEVDVLIGVAGWLYSNGWQLERISLPTGRGIDVIRNMEKLKTEFATKGISLDDISFRRQGEDIRARRESEIWKIECKGLGEASPQTDKNNFDRAIASTVSYYTQRDALRLGLALPEWYRKLIRKKVPQELRKAINLWIFLYVSHNEVYDFAPSEELPF